MKTNFLKIKQFCVCLIIVLIISLTFLGEAQAYQGYRTNKIGQEKFNDMKTRVSNSHRSIKEYKASDAYREITNALGKLQTIRTLVERIDNVDKVVDEVANGLDEIAFAYEKIADFGPEVMRHWNEKVYLLKDIDGQTLKTESDLLEEITELESVSQLRREQLDNITNEIEIKKINVDLKANSSRINSLKTQIVIWEKFHQTQEKLLGKLQTQQGQLDLMIYILDANAKVYREAANTARLASSAKSALQELGDLADLQGIVIELQDSWSDLDDIVNSIGKLELT
ncbi:hypothetical protein PCC8801_1270 [Rippkaea orientalis PCC 8801]|uniref:Uncharacterized protein n=1 Tax=Rippkaea orientalis (strain PCC 8801 / RF-1) TaxID=41431 RepID=B7K3J3_RIPO1|nr:hypothetical protein [Rippkaea orientalis]ACK65335.1 hypothetical protein PCC8801_1270 [Rippkaea orientalis PCC 8801]